MLMLSLETITTPVCQAYPLPSSTFSNEDTNQGVKEKKRAGMFIKYIVLLLSVLLGYLILQYKLQDPLVLNADSNHDLSAVLIYLPGANVPTEKYVGLAESLIREFEVRGTSLTLILVRYPKLFEMDLPPFWAPESMVTYALSFIEYNSATPLFLGGHSLGAIMGQIIVFTDNEQKHSYSGAILHSGYILDKYRQSAPLKVPTITISGTRDGLNRLTYLAMQYKDLRSHDRYLYNSPAILIEGMNHMHPAGGFYNNYTRQKDLEATISAEEAVRKTVEYSTLFLLNCLNQTVDLEETFEQVRRSENDFFLPYIAAIESDLRGETCVSAQKIHFGADASSRDIFASEPHLKRSKRVGFIFSKPKGNETCVKVQTYATKARTMFGRSSVPQAIQTFNCKLVTKEQLFGTKSEDFDMCGQVNQKLVDDALSKLSEQTRSDYASSPNKWIFGADHDYSGGFGWAFQGDVTFVHGPHHVNIVNPRLRTNPGNGRYGGKMNCGLVSKSRAVEHALIDAYRKKPDLATDDDTSQDF